MNEEIRLVSLREFMDRPHGWGRAEGREVYHRLLKYVESQPGAVIFKISLDGVSRLDISFASETVVELARRYRGKKGFCFVDLDDPDLMENWDSAALKKEQPLIVWRGKDAHILGPQPSEGNKEAFAFALDREDARATEFATRKKTMTISNASMKFKQLWEQGFLLRREATAESGGVEFLYQRIG